MYLRRISGRSQRWTSLFTPSKYLPRPNLSDHTCVSRKSFSDGRYIRRYFSGAFSSQGLKSSSLYLSSQLRAYSSEGDGRNASEEPVKTRREKVREDVRHCDTHAILGEQDQKEWLNNEKLSIESKKKESPFLTRRERFKNEFLRRVIPWEKINISWETFPYHLQ